MIYFHKFHKQEYHINNSNNHFPNLLSWNDEIYIDRMDLHPFVSTNAFKQTSKSNGK